MRTTIANLRLARGFALVELLLALAVGLVLALLLLPALAKQKTPSGRIRCVNNLKQVGLAFRIFAGDNSREFPMHLAATKGGTLEFSNEVWRTFQVMSNELSTPKVVACWSDERHPAASFSALANSNVSYFLTLEARKSAPEMILAGDRNLANGWPTTNRVLTITKQALPGWTEKLHQNCGNMLFANGSVQQVTSAKLQSHLGSLTNSTLHLAMPE